MLQHPPNGEIIKHDLSNNAIFILTQRGGKTQGDNKVIINYANQDGTSGIKTVTIGDYHIDIEYANGGEYRYYQDNVGKTNIAIMKTLALAGRGLNRFINKYVRHKSQRFGFQPPSTYKSSQTISTDDALKVLNALLDGKRISLVVN